MEAIYPVTALQKNQAEVRDAARQGVVRITEKGAGAYIFCSEDIFNEKIEQAVEEARYEERMDALISRGLKDVAAGRFYTNTDEAFAEIMNQRNRHA